MTEQFFELSTGKTELPHGLWRGDDVHKDATFVELSGKVRLNLEKQRRVSQNKINPGRVLSVILGDCVKTIGGKTVTPIDLNSLTVGDRNHLLLEIRKLSMSHILTGKVTCQNQRCEKLNDVNIDLNKVISGNVQAEKDYYRDNGESIVVLRTTDEDKADGLPELEIHIRYMNGTDQIEIGPKLQSNPALANFELYSRCLRKMLIFDDSGNVSKEKTDFSIDFCQTIPERILEWVEEKYNDIQPGPSFLYNVECYQCGQQIRVDIGDVDFLFKTRS